MTTEVLRNMLYEASPTLAGLQIVVLDEVHYLKDPYRGATWEEILIHLPPEVQVVALSATVSNFEEFGAWIRHVRGETEVVVEERRPVPIEHVYLEGRALRPMFVPGRRGTVPNPAVGRVRMPDVRRGRGGRRPPRRSFRPDRVEVIETLRDEGLLPAITFVFSRAGCEQAVAMCRAAGLVLTDARERERIREYVEMRASSLPVEDHAVLGYGDWAEALERGIAAHHAGLIPLFKETVEELFERALVKAVFATETLSLGINMPAKTVVIERLKKFTGERHEVLTESDYTQLTGRAGRRGMDPIGYGVVLAQPDLPFERIAELARGRSFPLISSFRPSYNMAVNLLRLHTTEQAVRLLNLSFGQFLADRSVVRQQREIERNERFLHGYRANVVCDRGDFGSYWALAREASPGEHTDQEQIARGRARVVRRALAALRPGEVVRLARGGTSVLGVIVELRFGKRGDPHPVVLMQDRRLARLKLGELREAPTVVGMVALPRGDPRERAWRQEVAGRLERMEPQEARADASLPLPPAQPSALSAHPVHDCPEREDHERWMLRIEDLQRETEALRKRVRRRTETLARTFEQVVEVLETFGYVEDGAVTAKGERLARIYNESDLLVAEALDGGVFDGLAAPELAAVVSTLVFETRVGEPRREFATDRARSASRKVVRIYHAIAEAEERRSLQLVREPDPGLAVQIHAWSGGAALEDVLAMGELSAGDFVRAAKQVWDLLRQLAEVSPEGPMAGRCRAAARAIYRGVVAYSGAL
jgi:ATP-dependent RNA helicase HelY